MTVKELIKELKEFPQDVPVTDDVCYEINTVELNTYDDKKGEHKFVRLDTRMLPLF